MQAPCTALLLLALLLVSQAGAAPAWVTDRFEITLRSGPSTSNEIRRMLPSGATVEVLERDADAGYARVRTDNGIEGWVLTRYLMDQRSAREQLASIARTVAPDAAGATTPDTQREVILATFQEAQQRIAALEASNAEVQQSLNELRRLSADTVQINARNQELSAQVTTLTSRLEGLRDRNAALQQGTTRQWFLTGAGVLFGGILLGLLLPRLRGRRDHGYGRL